ncbi:LysR substrate-binding domain-containing protein [Paracoccus liaowanqingii]|uniref:LysR substrate-binding domain-containing protein n=1 Tax=Paracoccus liaowanqingii TaxID=2560053 RepID=UPI0022B0B41F|nr:LysR substrate-binding domain-containing protein [Paracoccus liaowanqingii]
MPLNLAQLRAVEAAIRHNSFERAADELHVTPSAVSQQISKFERAVDTRLFDRHARGLTVTSDARDLGQRLALAFDIVEKAMENLIEERASGPVRLRIYQTWATRWLIPRLTHLHEKRPDVRVQFETGMQQAEFNRSGLDFAVQFIPRPQPDLLVVPLFPQVLVPVCAPAIAAGIQAPEMLSKHPLISSANRMEDWQIWFGAMKLADTAPKAQLVFSNSTLAYQAALAGSGIVIAQAHLIEQEIAAGMLVAPFPIGVHSGQVIGLVEPAGRRLRAAARAFKDWILAEAPSPDHVPDFLTEIRRACPATSQTE